MVNGFTLFSAMHMALPAAIAHPRSSYEKTIVSRVRFDAGSRRRPHWLQRSWP